MPETLEICIATVSGAHGVRGDIKLRSFTADPADVASYGPVTLRPGGQVLDLKLLRVSGEFAFVSAPQVKSPEAADSLRGQQVFVPRDRLPAAGEGEYYHADLIGLAVFQNGVDIGRVAEVCNYGAGDLLDIVLTDGRSVLVPFKDQSVPVVDVPGGRVEIDWPVGDMVKPARPEPVEERTDDEIR